MKLVRILSLSILLGSFLLVGCTPNDSSSSQSSGESSETSGGESGNENPSDLPWIG